MGSSRSARCCRSPPHLLCACRQARRSDQENFGVYGVRKVWRQLKREGHDVARCTVARLMQIIGLQGVIRGKPVKTTIGDKATPCPLDHVNRQFKAAHPECAVALRLHLCGDLGGLRLRRLCHRCIRAAHRWLALRTRVTTDVPSPREKVGPFHEISAMTARVVAWAGQAFGVRWGRAIPSSQLRAFAQTDVGGLALQSQEGFTPPGQ